MREPPVPSPGVRASSQKAGAWSGLGQGPEVSQRSEEVPVQHPRSLLSLAGAGGGARGGGLAVGKPSRGPRVELR